MDAYPLTLQILLTDACNLQCSYCFEKGKLAGRKLSLRVGQQIISRHLDSGRHSLVEIDFAGGEPLLAFDLIKDLVDFTHSKKWKCHHHFSLTTNGTLLDNCIREWFDEHSCIHITMSMDGLREVHNANRSGSYDRVSAIVPWYIKRSIRHGYPPTAKMTLTKGSISTLYDGIAHLHRLGFERIDANVPFEGLGTDDDLLDLLGEFAKQLDRLVYYYLYQPQLTPVSLVALPIHKIFEEDAPTSRWCGGGQYMLAYDTDGSAFPCHRFLPIATGSVRYTGPIRFDTIQDMGNSECKDCAFIRACPSCLAHNWEVNRNIDCRTTFHCPFILIQLKATAKLMALKNAALLREEGTSPTVVKELANADMVLEALDSPLARPIGIL